jgi:hypothetical protein
MPDYEKTISISNSGTRNEIRKRVVEEFLLEKPGNGKGDDATHYTYFVERLSNGKRIFLVRPGFMSKQFDYIINVEGVNFAQTGEPPRTAPTHGEIFADLVIKKREDPKSYAKVFSMIKRIYQCENVSEREFEYVQFKKGVPVDCVVLMTKWYFIEQDIVYWNYSGRAMFMSGIPEP